ncbi:glycosyltransferase family A protein [uncultured Dokdonia sp.]|uniref:glycosyltransferase family 2 protein n=1 Tax=uncultured Dokdonia sp. TaxID=575653 RepID=UPI00260B9964|nr:glycosyltransferase family A protein [uncultured Dokdonia sp.]
MIFLYHIHDTVQEIVDDQAIPVSIQEKEPAKALLAIAERYPEEWIIWCHVTNKEMLNIQALPELLHHKRRMVSLGNAQYPFLSPSIGYIEDSPFLKIIANKSYPTWCMSSAVGAIHASVLLASGNEITITRGFDYFLNSLARKGQAAGICCYHEPLLIKRFPSKDTIKKANTQLQYAFVKEHFKSQWLFFLLMCHIRYEKKFPLFACLNALLFVQKKEVFIDLTSIPFQSSKKLLEKLEIDVIIPTLGRKTYLYDVLKDFSKQTILPQKIVIVEQNPDPDSSSELDYITTASWPFPIEHQFIHQTGACNARNLALEKTEADWVFLFDDDNRFESNLLEKIAAAIKETGSHCINMSYLQEGEVEKHKTYTQWETFGSGCSVVHRDIVKNASFDMALEHGYGEDVDFGMQIRNLGYDVIYAPHIQILHLKAPIGGFRSLPTFPWEEDAILPKPAPQILFHRTKNTTKAQLKGYKWMLFFKYYSHQPIKNPFSYISYFKKAWKNSTHWAKKLPLDA